MLGSVLAVLMIPWILFSLVFVLVVLAAYHTEHDREGIASIEFISIGWLLWLYFDPTINLQQGIALTLAYIVVGMIWATIRWVICVRKFRTMVHDNIKKAGFDYGVTIGSDMNVCAAIPRELDTHKDKVYNILTTAHDSLYHDVRDSRSGILRAIGPSSDTWKRYGMCGIKDELSLKEATSDQIQSLAYNSLLPTVGKARGYIVAWIWLWPFSMVGRVVSDTIDLTIESVSSLFTKISTKVMGLPQ